MKQKAASDLAKKAANLNLDDYKGNYRYKKDPGNEWNPLKGYPRNHPCFCGSDIKHKKCCYLKVEEFCTISEAQKIRDNWQELLDGVEIIELVEKKK